MQTSERKITEISERISTLIEALGVNPNAFSVALGYKRSQTIYDIINGKSRPSFDFFNKLANSEYADAIDLRWVLTGRGTIFRTPSTDRSGPASDPALRGPTGAAIYDAPGERIGAHAADLLGSGGLRAGMRRVPLYEPTVSEGALARFDLGVQAPACYLQMPGLPACDGAIALWSDAMRPVLERGDIVLFETIRDSAAAWVWGKIYLLELLLGGSEYVAVQYVACSGDPARIRLESADPRFAAREIPFSAVRARAVVKGSIRCSTLE